MTNVHYPHQLGRRELFRIGAISILAPLGLASSASGGEPTPTRRRSCIFMLLQGGPSHHDLWDPKPHAPDDIRGPFGTVGSAIPGVRFGDLLPGTAKVADRICVIRSMTHTLTNHIAG